MLPKNITETVVQGLFQTLADMKEQLPEEAPYSHADGWQRCRQNWLNWLGECEHHLSEVANNLAQGRTITECDGIILFNVLRTIGDFYHALERKFVGESEDNALICFFVSPQATQ